MKKLDDWKTTGIIRGIKLSIVPQVGFGAYHGIGSDSYGYVIQAVAPDGTWFKYGKTVDGDVYGKAWLCTRKGSPICGCYIMNDCSNWGWAENQKPSMNARYARYKTIWPMNEKGCAETYLDPSF